ncbi:MAG: PAS domain S-box protein, partial [Candidatus Aminicenantes bacterium]|nr:PAS domain S-box protein [Candidatus Aminicenantes bacterium]
MKKEVETKEIIIKELQDIKERYKALYDRSLYFVYVHDFEGKFIDANKATLDLLGYSKEEIPSLSFSSLIDEDQLPTAVKTLGDILKYGHQKKPTIFKLRTKSGDYIWVETEASIIYEEGQP